MIALSEFASPLYYVVGAEGDYEDHQSTFHCGIATAIPTQTGDNEVDFPEIAETEVSGFHAHIGAFGKLDLECDDETFKAALGMSAGFSSHDGIWLVPELRCTIADTIAIGMWYAPVPRSNEAWGITVGIELTSGSH